MIKARSDGFFLMLFGCAAFLALGFLIVTIGRAPLLDFRTAYYSGRCLLDSGDPYSETEIEHLYSREVPAPESPDPNRIVVTRNQYLPSVFPVTVPFAWLPRLPALAIWLSLIAGSFAFACFAVWHVAANSEPLLSAGLLSFCLVNSILLLNSANPAGFVVPLCVLAVLSFVSGRFVPLGIACFAISLAFKPHDGGLIWLYFLLAGGLYRKRALQTLAVVAALSVPALFWVEHVAPNWLSEFFANLSAFSGPGHMNDPRGPHGACMMTNLQTVTSFFWNNPRIYNFVAYLVCGPLLLAWIYITLRAKRTNANTWFALASIAAFSVLPIYHRQYDAKLILLAIPALAILWKKRGRLAWIALGITAIAFFFDGDFPWVIFFQFANKLHLLDTGPYQSLGIVLADFPVPVSLLAMSVFYLWVYARNGLGKQNFDATEMADVAAGQTISAS
jgi:hypothetical protein